MDFETFQDILNRTLLAYERAQLVRRLVRSPEHFVGPFRASRPEEKLFQNIMRNRLTRFGDAMEEILCSWLEDYHYQLQDSQLSSGLEADLYFRSPDGKSAYLVETKVRDDHDSTKRRGQWDNFEAKVRYLYDKHEDALTAVFYFLDPALQKNRRFYGGKIRGLSNELNLNTLYLWYGGELFIHLTEAEDWQRFQNYLRRWKEGLVDLPSLSLDEPGAQGELDTISNSDWRRFISNDRFWEDNFIRTLFPTGVGLRHIAATLEQSSRKGTKEAAQKLRERLQQFYGLS